MALEHKLPYTGQDIEDRLGKMDKVITFEAQTLTAAQQEQVRNNIGVQNLTIKSVSESTESGGSNVITFEDGTTWTIKNGKDGTNGVGIASIEQTAVSTVDGGTNVFTVTLTNGQSATFTVKNGTKGSAGNPGTSVTVSNVSESTASGGENVVTFSDGETLTVKNGKDGAKGDPYTLTETDKAAIVATVIESLGGNPIYGYVDEDNNIILKGDLVDGTYSAKFEMENGSTVDIGDLVLDSNTYYSVTKNLTNCVIDNSATQVVEGGSYSATISANSGYDLSSVVVTMGGNPVTVSGGVINIDNVTGDIIITAEAIEQVATVYTITNNLTNCQNSNSATNISEGSAYNATISASDGYELSSVNVTMGGSAVSVSGGVISISSVSGDIVVTAVAEEIKASEPKNFVEYNDTNTTDFSIWCNNARIRSSGELTSDTDTSGGYGTPVVTNYVAVQNGDIVEFSGFYVANRASGVYDSSKGLVATAVPTSLTAYLSNVSLQQSNYSGTFTINHSSVGFVRIGGYIMPSSKGEPVIKIKRNGEYLTE